MPGAKITRYEHLKAIEEAGGEVDLEGPGIPQIVEHVFDWFLQLHSSRTGPITYSEIKAWSQLTGTRISPFEVDLIKRLDIEYLKQQDDGQRRS